MAPLGSRHIVGIVWEAERLPANDVPDAKLRPLIEVLPVPPLSAALRRLIEWTADYYCAPMPSVARMVIASGGALKGPASMTEYRLTGSEPVGRLTAQRKQALERSEEHTSELQSLMRISYAVFCLKKKTTTKNKSY